MDSPTNLAQFHPFFAHVADLWSGRTERVASEPAGGWKAFLAWLKDGKLGGFVHQRAVANGAPLPAWLLEDLQRERWHILANYRRIEETADQVCALLAQAGHKAVPLKGPWLNRRVYGDASLRRTTDLDLLVAPEAVAFLDARLPGLGYARRPLEHRVLWQAVYKGPGLVPVEAHVALNTPDENPPPSAEVLGRGGAWGQTGEGLDLPDALIGLAINNARDNLVLFPGNLHDVDAVARLLSEDDWDRVAERATRWRWRTGLQLNLLAARDLFGTPVPAPLAAPAGAPRMRTAVAWRTLRWYRTGSPAVRSLPRGLGSLYKAAIVEGRGGPAGYLWRHLRLKAPAGAS